MQGEFLSIETAQKITNLEKENKKLSDMVCTFDKEVNRLYNIIKEAYEYVDKQLFAEYVQEKDLKKILGAGLNKDTEEDYA